MFINNLFNNFQNMKETLIILSARYNTKNLILAVFLLLITSFLAGGWIINGSMLDIILALLYSVVSVACFIIIIVFYKQSKVNLFYSLLNGALMFMMLISFLIVFTSYDLSINEDINPLWMTLVLEISVTVGICLYFIMFKIQQHKQANVVMSNKSRAIIAIASASGAALGTWLGRSGLIQGGIKHLFYFGLIPLLIITLSFVIINYLMFFKYRQQLLAMEQQYYNNYNNYNNINQL